MIKLAAQQYIYSIDDVLTEDWNPDRLRKVIIGDTSKHVVLPHETYEHISVGDLTTEILHLEKVMNELTPKTTANIPFQGFYETVLSDMIECQLEDEDGDTIEPVSWADLHSEVAKNYAEQWASRTGIPIEFVKLTSPREYNFETDKIEVAISNDWVKGMRTALIGNDEFEDFVKVECASRSGFFSFVSNDLDEWPEVWGHREVTLAFQWLEQKLFSEVEEEIIDELRCNGGFSW